jgi:hypothetical protein
MECVPRENQPVQLDEADIDYSTKQDLLNRVCLCVLFDLVAQRDGHLPQYSELSLTDKRRFQKQSKRLFEVSYNYPNDRAYIIERSDLIIQEIELGVQIDPHNIHRDPYYIK